MGTHDIHPADQTHYNLSTAVRIIHDGILYINAAGISLSTIYAIVFLFEKSFMLGVVLFFTGILFLYMPTLFMIWMVPSYMHDMRWNKELTSKKKLFWYTAKWFFPALIGPWIVLLIVEFIFGIIISVVT